MDNVLVDFSRGRTRVIGEPAADEGIGNDLEVSLVTVVIPCFDQAHFLGEAIESVLAQTYPTIEIIVVDDGSPDNTREITLRYSSARYIGRSNGGLAAARNTGLRSARGSFVVFLDADDVLLPTAIEAGLTCFRSCPGCGFVAGGHRGVREDRSVLWLRFPRFDEEPYPALLKGNHIAMHAAVMYRRDVLEAVGGFDPSLAACEDYDLYLRIARLYPVLYHQELVAEYRQHGANISRDAERMLTTSLAVLRSQYTYVRGNQQYMSAYRAGERFWRRLYGVQLLRQVVADIRTGGQWPRVLRGSKLVLSRAPWALPTATAKPLRRAAGRLKDSLPPTVRRALRRLVRWSPAVGRVRFGDLRRVTPIDPAFGYGRGLPIDRYYIEAFLAEHAGDIHGRVLEVGDPSYTVRFGGGRVTRSDVLHVQPGNPIATIVADLSAADHIPSEIFDCIILTQTLHLIYDVRAAARTLHRILKPGGVLLATAPGISQIDPGEWQDTWCWSFTARSATQLFHDACPGADVRVEARGNVLTAISFLHGLAVDELTRHELDHRDPAYPVTVAIRAQKAAAA